MLIFRGFSAVIIFFMLSRIAIPIQFPDAFQSECLKSMYRLEVKLAKYLRENHPDLGIVEEHESFLSNMYCDADNLRDCWIKKRWSLSPDERFPVDGKIRLVIFFFDEEISSKHWVRKLQSPEKIIQIRDFPRLKNINIGIIAKDRLLAEELIKVIESVDFNR